MNAVPPKIAPANARFVVVLLTAITVGITAVVFFFNPSTHAFYPVCQFHRLTGLNCPGCGMTRALYALLHGDFSTALHDNALVIIGLGGLAVRGGWYLWNKFCSRENYKILPDKYLWLLLLVVALIFTVLRNLPAFRFLSP